MHAIGIDIGGTSAKIGVILEGQVIRQERIPTGSELDYELFIEETGKRIRALCGEYPAEKAGISSCGLIDSGNGSILYSNNIRWEKKKIAADLVRRTGLAVRIANDAKCAALAEAVFGAGEGYGRVCMITLGTGVGGAFIRAGRLDESMGIGSVYGDGDGILGHITVEHNGRKCTCGRRGCLEAYASAGAVVRTYQEKTGYELSAREIFGRVRTGERAAKETVALFTHYLAEGLVSLVNVLRPEIVVIGGGVSESADLFLGELRETVNREVYGGSLLPVTIEEAKLGNQAGMIGAALL